MTIEMASPVSATLVAFPERGEDLAEVVPVQHTDLQYLERRRQEETATGIDEIVAGVGPQPEHQREHDHWSEDSGERAPPRSAVGRGYEPAVGAQAKWERRARWQCSLMRPRCVRSGC
jgi:hypothetical protein